MPGSTMSSLRTPGRRGEFLVEIHYREPGYELRHGARREPYRFRYRVEATTEAAAVAHALAELERISAISAVGWIREVVGVEVIPVIGGRQPDLR